MRRIEEEMLNAVREKKNFCKNNTRVTVTAGENNENNLPHVHVFLHGNIIYYDNGREKYYSFACHDTNTTRSRLRALGLPIISKNGKRYAYGIELPIDSLFCIF